LRKRLEVKENPIIDTYSSHGNIVSIISGKEKIYPWILSRFLRVTYCVDNNYLDFCDGRYLDYYRCKTKDVKGNRCLYNYRNYEFLSETDITESVLGDDIISEIINCIDLNCYVFLYLDHFYIQGTDVYNKTHRNHETLIFGYDSDRAVFYTADNFHTGKYSQLEVDFSQLISARRSSEKLELKPALKVTVRDDYVFKINLDDIRITITDFLVGKDSTRYGLFPDVHNLNAKYKYKHNEFFYDFQYENKGFVYGLNVYSSFNELINSCTENNNEIDVRFAHLLCNHKNVVLELIKRIYEDKKELPEYYLDFEEIFQNCLILRNMIIKYNLTRNKSIISQLFILCKAIMEKEKLAFSSFLKDIESALLVK